MIPSVPRIRYAANSDDLKLAYQVFGEGPVDVVLVPGFISHVEYSWQEPSLARFYERLAKFARVICFDKRGMGQSDRDPLRDAPTLEQRVADIESVLDAAGSKTASVLAWSEGGPAAIAFAFAHPSRTDALLLIETTARFSSDDGFPAGIPREVIETYIETMETEWGSGVGYELYAPSIADDDRTRAWWSSYQRFAATPNAVAASLRMQLDVDVRQMLSAVKTPTLVFHRTNDMVVPVECGRYLAANIPGARYVEATGEDHMYWVGDQDELLRAIRARLTDTAAGESLARRRNPHRTESFGWESLTATELDVARLVAVGLTNRQIGGRLHVSPRTTQTHVTHILAKLRLQRRTEIAAEAARRDR